MPALQGKDLLTLPLPEPCRTEHVDIYFSNTLHDFNLLQVLGFSNAACEGGMQGHVQVHCLTESIVTAGSRQDAGSEINLHGIHCRLLPSTVLTQESVYVVAKLVVCPCLESVHEAMRLPANCCPPFWEGMFTNQTNPLDVNT